MKKVLIISNDNLGLGGIQSVIMSIVRGLRHECIFDIVVFNHDYCEYEEEFERQGDIFTIPQKTGKRTIRKRLDFYIRPFNLYRQIKQVIRKHGPYDIIHCHNYFEEAIALKVAAEENIPIRIAHCHSYMAIPPKKILRRAYNHIYRRMILKYSTCTIACSSIAGKYLYGDNNGTVVVANAINSNEFSYVSGKGINPWSFLHVGRWGGPKNQLFLLDVFYCICKQHKDSMLTLVGYGDANELQRIKEKIQSLKLTGRVTILPGDSSISNLMHTNNVFIFPSIFEGLGMVLIEAQATGMKCFASSKVPREADLGLVDFLDLNSGAQEWSDYICNYIRNSGTKRVKVELGDYDIDNNIKTYKSIYNV